MDSILFFNCLSIALDRELRVHKHGKIKSAFYSGNEMLELPHTNLESMKKSKYFTRKILNLM